MKKIHIRKPDIKGLSVKVRNLKFKDIKEHYKARKERRQKILEERRNSKLQRKCSLYINGSIDVQLRTSEHRSMLQLRTS